MDVKLSIGEDIGTGNPIKEEVKTCEMDSLKDEDIWRSRRERMNNALAAARTAARREPEEDLYAAASRLADVIKGADVEEFISEIERLANQTDPYAALNFQGLSRGSLLHVAAGTGKDDILRLLVDYAGDHLVAAQNDWGDTPLHMAAKVGGSRGAAILIRRARDLPNVKDKNLILRMKNKHGNTALDEAVLNSHADMMCLLLNEDLGPVYWENADQKSPLYLAIDTKDATIREVLFSLLLEPSKIQGLPPGHGAVMRHNYEFVDKILKKNMKLFAMTDSRGSNIFHLAAYFNRPPVFDLLRPETEYLARERDMNGDLPIHIASKMGHVDLIEKLHQASYLLNKRGQTVLHVASKYGRASAVRHILRHPDLGKLINERDHDGNTALHLAAMHFQPAALIPLVLDERIKPLLQNHKCLTALNVALHRVNWEYPPLRELMTCQVLLSASDLSEDSYICRPAARDKLHSVALSREDIPKMDLWKDVINTRLVVAALVTTVTFAAGFAVPGGFDNSDTASKVDQGMAVMLDKRMFQAFTICNTIAVFSSMSAVIILTFAQQSDIEIAITGVTYAALLMMIALPAMSTAFLTGVTLTVGKLPWLANALFFLGLIFLIFISGFLWMPSLVVFRGHRRPVLRLKCWLILVYIYFWRLQTYILDDPEKDGTATVTSASQPPDGAGELRRNVEDSPHPPNH